MKYLKLIFTLIIAGGIVVSIAWTQDEKTDTAAGNSANNSANNSEGVMVLNSKEFSQHQRPPVRFDHFLHEELIRCRACHHDFYIYSDMNKGKGSKCSKCHKSEAKKDVPIPLLQAFHVKCKGCHENYAKWERSTGPVMCGMCHKKNNETLISNQTTPA